MATYQSGLMSEFFRRKAQNRALTGLPTSYQEQRGLLDPILEYDARKTNEAGLLAQNQSNFDRQLALQERARKDQQTAGMVGGVGQLAMLPLAYGAAKNVGMLPQGFQLTSPSTWGGVTPQGAISPAGMATHTPGLLGVVSTAQGAVAPTVAGATTAQGMTLGGAAYPGIAGGTVAPGAVGEMSAISPAVASPGLLSTAGSVAGWGGAGYLGGDLLSKAIDANRPISRTIKGATTGAAIGSVVPGIGTVVGGIVGGIIGGISSLF